MKTIAPQFGNASLAWLAIAVLAAALLVCSSAHAGDDERGQLSSSDFKFAKAAACGGMFEINAGKIAAERSTNAAVQQFGQRMEKDHGKAGQDLEQLATRLGATLPSQPSADQQKEIDKLNKLAGTDFDKVYISLMVKAHKEDVKAFKKASEDVKNPDLKAFAATTLGMIQDHLTMAQGIEEQLKHNLASN